MSSPFTLTATYNGTTITLTDHTDDYICEYTGLNPPAAVIASQELYDRPGAMFVSQKSSVRNVVLQFSIMQNVQTVREELYTVFKMGRNVSFTFNNGSAKGTLSFSGVCETFEFSQFSAPNGAVLQGVQISILCFDPYLYGAQITTNTASAITYGGDYPVGFSLEYPFDYSGLMPSADVAFCTLTNGNTTTECYFDIPEVEGSGTYVINSATRHAQIQQSGGNTWITRYWRHGSVWPMLLPGSNTISPTDSDVVVKYKPAYMGV